MKKAILALLIALGLSVAFVSSSLTVQAQNKCDNC